ncbi:MAG: hypothetical protein ABI811_05245 [Acidobacteriota bacterium]
MAALATPVKAASPPAGTWSSVVGAMTKTGGASLASGLLSLLATKILAVELGPSHMALFATLQQVRQTAVTAGTLTGQTALVQGTSSTEGRARREFLRTAACLMLAASAIVCGVLLAAPAWAAERSGLPAEQARLAGWVVLAVLPAVVFVFLAALLNAFGAIGALAWVQLAAPAAMALLAYPVARNVAHGNTSAFVLLLAGTSLAAIVAAGFALRSYGAALRTCFHGEGSWLHLPAARKFFAISGSMFASGLFSSWAVLTVRARILNTQGLHAGGEFDAAWAVSMNQAGLVLASLQTYYLPLLARTSDPRERSVQIARVLTVASLSGAVLIVILILGKSTVLSLLYSPAFAGGERYLRWTLVGDYLKIASWIFSIPLLAAGNMRAFLAADLSAYAGFLIVSSGLARWFTAAEAASIGFVALYAVHLIFCGSYLWSRGEFRPRPRTAVVWLGGLALIAATSVAFWSPA